MTIMWSESWCNKFRSNYMQISGCIIQKKNKFQVYSWRVLQSSFYSYAEIIIYQAIRKYFLQTDNGLGLLKIDYSASMR